MQKNVSKFKIGDRVRIRDHLDWSIKSRFGYGKVERIDESGVWVKPDGWTDAVQFLDVQHCNGPGAREDEFTIVEGAATHSFVDMHPFQSGTKTRVATSFMQYPLNIAGSHYMIDSSVDWNSHIFKTMTSLPEEEKSKAQQLAEQKAQETQSLKFQPRVDSQDEPAVDPMGYVKLQNQGRRENDWKSMYDSRIYDDGCRPDLRTKLEEYDIFNHVLLYDSVKEVDLW